MPAQTPHSLPGFASLTQNNRAALTNRVNEAQLTDWLNAISQDRLERPLPASGARSSALIASRPDKAAAWLATVARKHMIRDGAATDWEPTEAELAAAPAWAAKSLASGARLTALTLSDTERSSLESCLDWMMAETGPNPASDWSKISLPQAIAGERAWIEALSIAEERRRDKTAADLGETVFLELSPHNPAPDQQKQPWRWVQLMTSEALEREGSTMRNCIGKYHKHATETLRYYSLRDMAGKPLLSAHVRDQTFSEVKAFANAKCPRDLVPQVARLVKAIEAQNAEANGSPMNYNADLLRLGFTSASDGVDAGWMGDPSWIKQWSASVTAGISAERFIKDYSKLMAANLPQLAQSTFSFVDWRALTANDFDSMNRARWMDGTPLRAAMEQRMAPDQALILLWPTASARDDSPTMILDQAEALAKRLDPDLIEPELSSLILRGAAWRSDKTFEIALARARASAPAFDASAALSNAIDAGHFDNAKTLLPLALNKSWPEKTLANAARCDDPAFFAALLAGSDISASAGRLIIQCAAVSCASSTLSMMKAVFNTPVVFGFERELGLALNALAKRPGADPEALNFLLQKAPVEARATALVSAAAAQTRSHHLIEWALACGGESDLSAVFDACSRRPNTSSARLLLSSGRVGPAADTARALEFGSWNDDEAYARLLLARPGAATMTESVLLNAIRLGSADFLNAATTTLPLGIEPGKAAAILFTHGDLTLANAAFNGLNLSKESLVSLAESISFNTMSPQALSIAAQWAAGQGAEVSAAFFEKTMALNDDASVNALSSAIESSSGPQMERVIAANPSAEALAKIIERASADPSELALILAHPSALDQAWKGAARIVLNGEPSHLANLLHAIPPPRLADGQARLDELLRSAAQIGRSDMARVLLPLANANARDRHGLTSLIHASLSGDEATVDALLPASDVSAKGVMGVFKGVDAEHAALQIGSVSIAEKLANARLARAQGAASPSQASPS